MGPILKIVPEHSSRLPTSSELRSAITAAAALGGYSLADQHREADTWYMSILLVEGVEVSSQLSIHATLAADGSDNLAHYYCQGTSDALRLVAREVARFAGPQVTFETDTSASASWIGAYLSPSMTRMEMVQ